MKLQQYGLAAGVLLALLVTGCGGSSESGGPVGGSDNGGLPSSPATPATPVNAAFFCTFDTSPTDCGFQEQGRTARASIVGVGRDGDTAVRLHTQPGDNNVSGSGDMERNDLLLSQAESDVYEGREQWWAHSMMFPNDFAMPTWHVYVLADFHHSGPTGQANFMVLLRDNTWTFTGFGGPNVNGGQFRAVIGTPQKNVWYDFVYHIRWSSGPDGFFDAWVNGKRVLAHQGPTLYSGQGAYFKLANYHTPVCDPYPTCIGTQPPSSVIHDRVVRGHTALSVAPGPLEGVLALVNGVLTPVQ
jgi:hypothetical protein